MPSHEKHHGLYRPLRNSFYLGIGSHARAPQEGKPFNGATATTTTRMVAAASCCRCEDLVGRDRGRAAAVNLDGLGKVALRCWKREQTWQCTQGFLETNVMKNRAGNLRSQPQSQR